MKNQKIGVLMGGLSKEREVSFKSGRGVLKALQKLGYQVVEIDADRSVAKKLDQEKVDVAVVMLHGRWGEDGTIQGMLEVMGIPYTGTGPLASAITMDKDLTKRLLKEAGVEMPQWKMIRKNQIQSTSELPLSLPFVVKPNREGSTMGVSIVKKGSEFRLALETAAKFDDFIMVESFAPGKELTVGLVGGKALPVLEIVPKSGFFDFDAKYTKGMTEYIVPARIPETAHRQLKEISEKIFEDLGLSGMARIDFMGDASPQFLEVNTIPGMTETSLVPMAARAQGMSYEDLCEKILEGASLKLKQ